MSSLAAVSAVSWPHFRWACSRIGRPRYGACKSWVCALWAICKRSPPFAAGRFRRRRRRSGCRSCRLCVQFSGWVLGPRKAPLASLLGHALIGRWPLPTVCQPCWMVWLCAPWWSVQVGRPPVSPGNFNPVCSGAGNTWPRHEARGAALWPIGAAFCAGSGPVCRSSGRGWSRLNFKLGRRPVVNFVRASFFLGMKGPGSWHLLWCGLMGRAPRVFGRPANNSFPSGESAGTVLRLTDLCPAVDAGGSDK